MFYKGQIDEIAASLENEFAKDGLKIVSQYNAIWVVLSNGRFGIEVKDGLDDIYFKIQEEDSDKVSYFNLRQFHSVSMMTKVVRMAFDEMALGYHKMKSCGCSLNASESHQDGCKELVSVPTGASFRLPGEW
jgi:hypothetical protein